MYYFIVALSSFLFGIGILTLKKPFFNLAIYSVGLLDIMIDTGLDDEVKQDALIKRLGKLLLSLLVFVLGIFWLIALFIVPIYIFSIYTNSSWDSLEMESWAFIASSTLPSIIPFVLASVLGNVQLQMCPFF